MHDLFVSYAREDEAWVERFCELLKTDGLIVWKDSSIPTGKSFGRVIEEAIASSRAVVVVWSHYSIDSDWVRAEATEGLRRGILMPVQRDASEPPLRFRTIQTIDLAKWKFEADYPAYRRLVGELWSLIQAVPPDAQLEEHPQNESAPAPVGSGKWRYLMAIAGVLLTAALGAALWHWFSVEKRGQLSIELTAASIAALDEVGSRYNSSGHYWRYFLDEDGGQLLVDRSVLLALEAVKAEATPQAIEALRQSLVLLRRPLQEFRSLNAANRAEIAPDGIRIAWSHRNGVQLLDTLDEANNRDLESDGRVAGLVFLGDSDYLAAVGGDGGLDVWNLASGKKLLHSAGSGENTIDFALNASASRIAVRQAGLVTVLELPGGRKIAKIDTDRFVNLSAYQSLDLSPDGTLLAIALKDEVVIWDLEKGEERFRIAVGQRVSGLGFDPEGKLLLAFSSDGGGRLINPTYGDSKDFSLQRGADLIRFSSAPGRFAFTAGGQVRVALLDAPGKPILQYGHADNVKYIRFSEDGRLIASAGQDGMVRVWDIEAGRELSRFAYKDQVLALRFSPDGNRVTAIARNGQVGIWPIAYDDPATEACRGLKRNLTPEEWHQHLGSQPYRRTCTTVQP